MSEDEWILILSIIILAIIVFVIFYIFKNTNFLEAILNFKLPKPWGGG
ncbi:MAG: hypothetical protein QW472_02920 [Candidatus Aenigmatarchaeota archaeon]